MPWTLKLPGGRGLLIAGVIYFFVGIIGSHFGYIDQEIFLYHAMFIWFPVVAGGAGITWVMIQIIRPLIIRNIMVELLVGMVELGLLMVAVYTSNFFIKKIMHDALIVPLWVAFSIFAIVGWRTIIAKFFQNKNSQSIDRNH